MLLLSGLTGCSATKAIFATRPEGPAPADTVRILCARGADGAFVFGVILASRSDTPETQEAIVRHNRAWRAATEDGALCK